MQELLVARLLYASELRVLIMEVAYKGVRFEGCANALRGHSRYMGADCARVSADIVLVESKLC